MTADEDSAIAGRWRPATGGSSTPLAQRQRPMGGHFRDRTARRVRDDGRGGRPARSSGQVIRIDRGRAIAVGIANGIKAA
jgi:hypothetical protein